MLMSRCAFSITLAASAARQEHVAAIDGPVHCAKSFGNFRRLARNHFRDAINRVFAVAGIDAFGAVAQKEIDAANKARGFRDFRSHDFFGDSRINRAFEHDDAALANRTADRAACGDNRAQVRAVGFVDGRRHRHDKNIGPVQGGSIGRHCKPARFEAGGLDLVGTVVADFQLGHPRPIEIEARDAKMRRKSNS
jgi:hypothetical protein